MEKRDIGLALAVAVLALTGGSSGAADQATFNVVLRLTDQVGTNRSDITRAEAEARRIFDYAGVRLVWVDIADRPVVRACEGLNLYVSFVSPSLVRQQTRQGNSADVLGFASLPTEHAFIYSERVSELAPGWGIDQGVLLGRVIAHEIGHLLLGGHDHSRSGLMTARMENEPTGLRALFDSKDVRTIRLRLESSVAKPEARTECEAEAAVRQR